MRDKLAVLLCVAALATSDLQEAPVYFSPAPSPIQYVPVNPGGPAIYTYSSNPTAPKDATVEAYQTVTTHPPPSAYKASPTVTPYVTSKPIQAGSQYFGSPTVTPYDPSKLIQPGPQYIGSPTVTPYDPSKLVQPGPQYIESPTVTPYDPSKLVQPGPQYIGSPTVTPYDPPKLVQPGPQYIGSPTVAPYDPSKPIQAGPQYIRSPTAYPVSPVQNVSSNPAQGYSGVPIIYVPVPVPNGYGSVADPAYSAESKKYAGRNQIQLVDSSKGYTPDYVPQYPGTRSTPTVSPPSIPIPVEYPTALGKDVGSHVVYAPVENSEGYNRPMHKPLATYAVQSAYANYVRAVGAYSSAPAVSRVNFNGLGASYEY